MLLKNKHAVIYGAAGLIGRVVAHVFAREGATVYVVGRTLEKLNQLADEITNNGGKAIAAAVNATSEAEVNEHVNGIIKTPGESIFPST